MLQRRTHYIASRVARLRLITERGLIRDVLGAALHEVAQARQRPLRRIAPRLQRIIAAPFLGLLGVPLRFLCRFRLFPLVVPSLILFAQPRLRELELASLFRKRGVARIATRAVCHAIRNE